MKLLPWPLKNAGVSAMEQSASKIYLEQRQNEILDLLEKQGSVRVTNLSAHFGISGATIRKDIRALEEQGKLRRTHGGAISIERSEISREEAEMTSHPQKTAIAKRAAQLVVDGDIFLVQSGSTCLEFVRALKGKRNITLITCDLKAALLAEEVLENGTVIILGGPLRPGYHYSQGSEPLKQLRNYRLPKAFISTNAFSFGIGFTAHQIAQAEWVRAITEQAESTIMLMDSSKIGGNGLSHSHNLTDIDCLIIDSGVSESDRARFAEEAPGLEIIYA